MKKYKGEVTNEIKLEFEIDETIWDEKAITTWRNIFYTCRDVKELASLLAESIMRNGIYSYHEGFGILKVLDFEGSELSNAKRHGSDYCAGITVILSNYYEDGYIKADLLEVE